jgi:sporulation protein YlmC with PRC-barrel domain
MLRSTKEVYGYDILATDGEIGVVDDFYFDDQYWTIRYLVVNTHKWLPGRRVLVSLLALGQPDWGVRTLPVTLTREQVEKSPDVDLERPVSRQHEIILNEYYGWATWWTAMRSAPPPPAYVDKEVIRVAEGDPHLRSTKEVAGYHIQATDGKVGHVEDFILYDRNWTIRYLVVNTGNWLLGRKVLMVPLWIEDVKWAESKIQVDLNQESIKNSPEYDPSAPVNRVYEERLYDYYGRPMYWA